MAKLQVQWLDRRYNSKISGSIARFAVQWLIGATMARRLAVKLRDWRSNGKIGVTMARLVVKVVRLAVAWPDRRCNGKIRGPIVKYVAQLQGRRYNGQIRRPIASVAVQ